MFLGLIQDLQPVNGTHYVEEHCVHITMISNSHNYYQCLCCKVLIFNNDRRTASVLTGSAIDESCITLTT